MEVDTVIVGAGAAGIGAARALQGGGRSVIVLEARNRVGGRAWTDHTTFGCPVDMGAKWLHSADINPLVPLARAAGFNVRPISEDWSANNARRLLDTEQRASLATSLDSYFTRIQTLDLSKPDCTLASLAEGLAWPAIRHALITWICGAPPAQVSAADLSADHDRNTDWPIRERMGTLVSHLADALPVRLGCIVTEVDWTASSVSVTTATSGTLRCRNVVVTLPTNVLAAESIRFTPALPEHIRSAWHDLPQGLNERIVLGLHNAASIEEEIAYSAIDDPDAGHLHIKPTGQPYITVWYGADAAKAVSSMTDEAAAAEGADRVCQVFGGDFRRHLHGGLVTRWHLDPFARGAYSYARPGRRTARTNLARPIADRLYFAGEATYPDHYATVHGAFLSGQRAAEQILKTH